VWKEKQSLAFIMEQQEEAIHPAQKNKKQERAAHRKFIVNEPEKYWKVFCTMFLIYGAKLFTLIFMLDRMFGFLHAAAMKTKSQEAFHVLYSTTASKSH
jgi:1,2-phenylacetyl-CoA epoxidase catalytic subunit